MNRHYENYLIKKYTPLYIGHKRPITENLMGFGFECGDGWFNIINSLSFELCHDWFRAQHEYKVFSERVGQTYAGKFITPEIVKQKKNALKRAEARVPLAVQVKEKFGTLRFYANNCTETHNKLINFAELMSAVTCEVCGSRGKVREGGWLRCLCNEHNQR